MGAFTETTLWKHSLGPDSEFSATQPKYVERLRVAYIAARDRVAPLLSNIPNECKGLTVHDITHLDALWETASLVAGENYRINPAEAFVFGCAVLLHDTGMGCVSYQDGLESIIKTDLWRDVVCGEFRRAGLSAPNELELKDRPEDIKERSLFHTLRGLHAKQARALATREWRSPTSASSFYIVDDAILRESYGDSIGRIAESHNRTIEQIRKELRSSIGAIEPFPSAWTVNEVKLACLLRCADAAHIDHRRAPTLQFSLNRPTGLSRDHWTFQNRLCNPIASHSNIVYTSRQDFPPEDFSAWWLCYDTIQMIDDELRQSNSLLSEIGSDELYISGVLGAHSPSLLSKYIRPADWTPVNAEIRVSEPQRLAATLGGGNLYGNNPIAPIRELIQNSIDAIRMRVALEGRSGLWGTIVVSIRPDPDADDKIEICVDDTGVGMSERVLIGPLIDFGKSIWSSNLLQEEYPGLESKGVRGIGRFGIGFFSIFMLSEEVTVISRRFDEGVDGTRALELFGLNSRGLLRPARADELPLDFSTRVKLRVPRKAITKNELLPWLRMYRRMSSPITINKFTSVVLHLVASLDMRVVVKDDVNGKHVQHEANWLEMPREVFLGELYGFEEGRLLKRELDHIANSLEEIKTKEGETVDLAALNPIKLSEGSSGLSFISVGGVTYPTNQYPSNEFAYVGIIGGDASNVARTFGERDFSTLDMKDWVERQSNKLDRKS